VVAVRPRHNVRKASHLTGLPAHKLSTRPCQCARPAPRVRGVPRSGADLPCNVLITSATTAGARTDGATSHVIVAAVRSSMNGPASSPRWARARTPSKASTVTASNHVPQGVGYAPCSGDGSHSGRTGGGAAGSGMIGSGSNGWISCPPESRRGITTGEYAECVRQRRIRAGRRWTRAGSGGGLPTGAGGGA
jgi:hypothetical protein